MNIDLIVVGKTDSEYVEELVADYRRRINFYAKFSIVTVPDLRNTKNLTAEGIKRREGEAVLKLLDSGDYVVLLDVNGSEHRSVEFASWLQKRFNTGLRRLVFIIGGAYGFSNDIYGRANEKVSLSKMTFSHQTVRVIFTEQLYRAFTILRNEPYHH